VPLDGAARARREREIRDRAHALALHDGPRRVDAVARHEPVRRQEQVDRGMAEPFRAQSTARGRAADERVGPTEKAIRIGDVAGQQRIADECGGHGPALGIHGVNHVDDEAVPDTEGYERPYVTDSVVPEAEVWGDDHSAHLAGVHNARYELVR